MSRERDDAIVRWHHENDMVLILTSLALFAAGLFLMIAGPSLPVPGLAVTIVGGSLVTLGMTSLIMDMVLQRREYQFKPDLSACPLGSPEQEASKTHAEQ